MIVKMKFLSITGPKADIDRVVDEYLSKYEIHLENALSELMTVTDLKPYIEINPYKADLAKVNSYLELLGDDGTTSVKPISVDAALDAIKTVDEKISDLREKRIALESKREKLQASLKKIEPFRELHYNIKAILDFKFIKFRFGKIPAEYFRKFETYVYEDLNTLFYKCDVDDEYVWGVYFVPVNESHKIDAVYKSLHFERFYLPDEYSGTPEEALLHLQRCEQELSKQITVLTAQMNEILNDNRQILVAAGDKLNHLSTNFDVRKLAACTTQGHENFYIICGWMAEADAQLLEKDIEDDENLYCIIEDDQSNISSHPPTKLKNLAIFKPFEMFIKMYGLPAYNEIDPTFFVAISYAFIFGAMFGDVGQGLCLVVGGFLLYKLKGVSLGAIIGTAGIFSTFFGFMFGSFFGFEDVIPALWLHPISKMTSLPFFGRLNTVFIVAIAFGIGLILLTMIFHIINAVKAKDVENIWFDTNGVAGFVFFGAVATVLVLYMTGNKLPAGIVLVIMFVVPLLVIALKEPLTRIVEKKAGGISGGIGMFLVQTFFEMFEVLLSYFSNVLSFVRIGAFAVSHAAMMEVVLMLAGVQNGGNANWVVVVLGNLIVCLMEGLIVGIQVLRLEYYEMFSRFYKGTGREFIPFTKIRKVK